jgi:hypothetical protein
MYFNLCSSEGKGPNENLELWDGKQGDEWTGQVPASQCMRAKRHNYWTKPKLCKVAKAKLMSRKKCPCFSLCSSEHLTILDSLCAEMHQRCLQMDSVKREMKKRMDSLEGKIGALEGMVTAMDRKMHGMESRMTSAINEKMTAVESKLAGMDSRMTAMESGFKSNMGALEGKLDEVLAFLRDRR